MKNSCENFSELEIARGSYFQISNLMKKIALALLILFSFGFCLNVTASSEDGELQFRIDGQEGMIKDLKFYFFKNEVQINSFEKSVTLPYYNFVSVDESGEYMLKVMDKNNPADYGEAEITYKAEPISIQNNQTINVVSEETVEKSFTDPSLAIIAGVVGIIVIALLFISFIKIKSDKK
ncbi:hypothetical protein KJ780_04235 [Candidatus Micrarchaeota archaeon]|nr:hypothetical protein [Candidatus Micrarchaeota archaeon]